MNHIPTGAEAGISSLSSYCALIVLPVPYIFLLGDIGKKCSASGLSSKKKQLSRQDAEIQAVEAFLANLEEYTVKKEKEAKEARLKAELAKKEALDRKNKLEQSAEVWKQLETSARNRYEQYSAMTGYEKEEYTDLLKKKEKEQKDLKETVFTLDIASYELKDARNELDKIKQKEQETVVQAEELYKKYCSVAVTDRQYHMFEDMLELERKNMQLEAENNRLQEKLQKAYGFMKQITINGDTMLDHFLKASGKKAKQFAAGIGRR